MKRLLLLALLSAPIGAFAQGVVINGQGTATLSWTRPTTNTDGSPLAQADITAYGVFFGPQSRFSSGTTLRSGCTATPPALTSTTCYAGAVQIAGGATQGAPVTLTGITSNTRIYFAVAAQRTGGQISAYSNEAFKDFVVTVNAPPSAPVLQDVNVTVTCTTNDPQITCSITVE